MQHITSKNIEPLSLGSVFFGTGGGSTIAEHHEAFARAFTYSPEILLAGIDEFQPTDTLISVYMVGDPSQSIQDIPTLLNTALTHFKNKTGLTPAGIIPGELGCIETAFEVAAITELPVVDSDLVGGRAAPEMTLDTFTVHQRSITPVLALCQNGEEHVYVDPIPTSQLEKGIRSFVTQHGGLGVIIGYSISAQEYAKIGMSGTVTRAEQTGRALQSHDLNTLLKEIDGTLLSTETLTAVDLRSENGFLMGTLQLEHYALHIKNEHMVLEHDGDIIAFAPDLFILLDSETLVPIHNAKAHEYLDHTISLIHIPAQGYWNTSHGQELWTQALTAQRE